MKNGSYVGGSRSLTFVKASTRCMESAVNWILFSKNLRIAESGSGVYACETKVHNAKVILNNHAILKIFFEWPHYAGIQQ